jgi:hypothetical protein
MPKFFLISFLILCGCACEKPYLGKVFIPAAPYSDNKTGYINWTTDSSCMLNWVNINYIQPVNYDDQRYEYGYGSITGGYGKDCD